jgi:hypothetical protein
VSYACTSLCVRVRAFRVFPLFRPFAQLRSAHGADTAWTAPVSPETLMCPGLYGVSGLLRQHFSKGADLSRHSRIDLKRVQREFHHRPRAALNAASPTEIFTALRTFTTVPMEE